jgi:hypothetical protein
MLLEHATTIHEVLPGRQMAHLGKYRRIGPGKLLNGYVLNTAELAAGTKPFSVTLSGLAGEWTSLSSYCGCYQKW